MLSFIEKAGKEDILLKVTRALEVFIEESLLDDSLVGTVECTGAPVKRVWPR